MKVLFYSICLLMSSNLLLGQIDGYIIDRNNREVAIVVNIPWTPQNNFNELQFQKKPKQLVNGKKQIINPNEVLELGFHFRGRRYVYRPIPRYGRLQFKRLILDGEVSVFEELQTAPNQTSISYVPLRSTYSNTRYLICQEGENAFYPTSWNFKRRLIKKLRDCPEFKRHLLAESYELADVIDVIKAYNKMCNE